MATRLTWHGVNGSIRLGSLRLPIVAADYRLNGRLKTFLKVACIALRNAAWAPALVILFRGLAMLLGLRKPLDHVIHFSGGVATAYFMYRLVKIAYPIIGSFSVSVRYALAFTSACTIALFWEFGEFASDLFRGTHIQHSVSETLFDLIYGSAGAVFVLVLIAIINSYKSRTTRRANG